jgi:L-arabinose isomerase
MPRQRVFYARSQRDPAIYDRTARVSLALRKWKEEKNLTALTVNFLATENSNPALPVMPFTECSRMMTEGTGTLARGMF